MAGSELVLPFLCIFLSVFVDCQDYLRISIRRCNKGEYSFALQEHYIFKRLPPSHSLTQIMLLGELNL
jgi:hypothetical protein